MHHSFYLLFPLALAATPGMALEILDPKHSAPSAEARYRILIRIAVALTILLIVSSLMTFHPEIGAVLAEYNRFS